MRLRIVRILLLSVVLCALSGCYTTKFYFPDTPGGYGHSHKVMQHTFFWGLVSPGQVNLGRQCGPPGIKRIKSQVGGWGLLANWLTGGLWVPVTVKITCAG